MFLQCFSRNLLLSKEPDENINYSPYKVEEFPEEERETESACRSAYDTKLERISLSITHHTYHLFNPLQFLSNWGRTYTTAKTSEKGLVKTVMSAFKTVAGQPSKSPTMNPETEYGKRYWHQGLRKKYHKAHPEGTDLKLFLKSY